MSRVKVVKGSQRLADQQRGIFDEFCQKHGVPRTRGGSWIVYKGTHRGVSPLEWSHPSLRVDYAAAADGQKTVRGKRRYTGGISPSRTVTVSSGGRCNIDPRTQCGTGIHFCFTRTAARQWGRAVYELHIPPSAAVCFPDASHRIYDWYERLGEKNVKARASHVRVMGKAKPTRGPRS